MKDLSIVCTDRGRHAPVELGVIQWTPPEITRGTAQFAVWSIETPLRDLDAEPIGDSARGTKSNHPNKQIHRAAVRRLVRADGGATFVFPRCPRCAPPWAPGPRLRDDTLREYADKTLGSALEGSYDVSAV